jgi:hypothetical protein
MELTPTNYIQIEGTSLHINVHSLSEAKIALKELKLKKKEYGLWKRAVNEQQKGIRAAYTEQVRSRGSMMRGGGGFGKFVRAIQTMSRDSKRGRLAHDLSPLGSEKQYIEAMIRTIDSAILQVDAYILRNSA